MSTTLSNLKGVSARDQQMIRDTEAMLGPEPSEMGFVKNLFWGNFREELVFPYPKVDPEEKQTCDMLLARLEEYLKNEHPAVQIDQELRLREAETHGGDQAVAAGERFGLLAEALQKRQRFVHACRCVVLERSGDHLTTSGSTKGCTQPRVVIT